MPPRETYHLRAYFRLILEQDVETGFLAWARKIDELLQTSDFDLARQLITEMKQFLAGADQRVSPDFLMVIRSSEGALWARMGEWGRADSAFASAWQQAHLSQDIENEAWVLADWGNVGLFAGDLSAAEDRFRRAISMFEAAGNQKGKTIVLANLGSVYRETDRLDEARSCYEQVLCYSPLDSDLAAVTLANLGSILQLQEDFVGAEEAYLQAVALFEANGDQRGRAQSLGNLGTLYLHMDKPDQAVACFSEDLAIQREIGDHASQARILNNLGIAYRRLGRWKEAKVCYEHSLMLRRELDDQRGEEIVRRNLARLEELLNNFAPIKADSSLDVLIDDNKVYPPIIADQ